MFNYEVAMRLLPPRPTDRHAFPLDISELIWLRDAPVSKLHDVIVHMLHLVLETE